MAHNANGFTSRFPAVAVDGIPVFDGSAQEAVLACSELVASGGGRVATANLDFLALARRDPVLKSDLQQSHLVVADGMPVVWLARLTGARRVQRLAGVDLVGALFAATRDEPLRVAVYGSTAEICAAAVPALHAMGDGARVVHIQNPPFRPLTPEEREAGRLELMAARPDLVLVALGCPAQERLIAEWSALDQGPLWIGIGGTLDFYGGVRRRAPQALQRLGLEWAARMAQDPRRLGRRYLLRDLPALVVLAPGCLAARTRRRPHPPA